MTITTHCYANPARRLIGGDAFVEEHKEDIDVWLTPHKLRMKNNDIHIFITTPLSAHIDVLDGVAGELDFCDLRCWMIELRTRLENMATHARAVEDVLNEEGD